jgi:hypothetical protein
MNINKRYDNTGGSPGVSTDKVSPENITSLKIGTGLSQK